MEPLVGEITNPDSVARVRADLPRGALSPLRFGRLRGLRPLLSCMGVLTEPLGAHSRREWVVPPSLGTSGWAGVRPQAAQPVATKAEVTVQTVLV